MINEDINISSNTHIISNNNTPISHPETQHNSDGTDNQNSDSAENQAASARIRQLYLEKAYRNHHLNSEFYTKYKDQIEKAEENDFALHANINDSPYLRIFPSNTTDRITTTTSQNPPKLPESISDLKFVKSFANEVGNAIKEFRETYKGNPIHKDTCRNFLIKWAKNYQIAINKILRELGIPPPTLKIYSYKTNNNDYGEFSVGKWNTGIYIENILNRRNGENVYGYSTIQNITFDEDSGLMESAQHMLTFEKKLADLAETLFHEAFHTLQAWQAFVYSQVVKSDLQKQIPDLKNKIRELEKITLSPSITVEDVENYENIIINLKNNKTIKLPDLENKIRKLDLSPNFKHAEKALQHAKNTISELENKLLEMEKFIFKTSATSENIQIYKEAIINLENAYSTISIIDKTILSISDNIYLKNLPLLIGLLPNEQSFCDEPGLAKTIQDQAIQAVRTHPDIRDLLLPEARYWWIYNVQKRKNVITNFYNKLIKETPLPSPSSSPVTKEDQENAYRKYADALLEAGAFKVQTILSQEIHKVILPQISPNPYILPGNKKNLEGSKISSQAKVLLAALAIKQEVIESHFASNLLEARGDALLILAENFKEIEELGQQEENKKVRSFNKLKNKFLPSSPYSQFKEVLHNIAQQFASLIPEYKKEEVSRDLSLNHQRGYFSLTEIFNNFATSADWKKNLEYALVTPNNHPMVLGRKNKIFCFYDPYQNIKFNSADINNFKKKLMDHFHPDRCLDYEITVGDLGIGRSTFKFAPLDTSSLAKATLTRKDQSLKIGEKNNITANELVLSHKLQRFFMNSSGQNGKGRCYSEAILGSIALEKEGSAGLNRYLETLKTIHSSKKENIIHLKESIETLHYYLNDEYGLKEGDLKFSLEKIIENLMSYSDSSSFKLGTPNHAMVVQIVKNPGGNLEYFLLNFDNSNDAPPDIRKAFTWGEFQSQINSYFTKNQLAAYQLPSENPLFEFKKINMLGIVKNIPISVFIDQEPCFVSPEELATTSDLDQFLTQIKEKIKNIYTIISDLKREKITDYYLELPGELQESTEKLFKDNIHLSPKKHIIHFNDIIQEEEGYYKIPIIDINSISKSPIYIKSLDPTFNRAKEFILNSSSILKKSFNKVTNQFHVDHATLGMNTAFSIRNFIHWYYRNKKENNSENESISNGLKLALTAHSYLNLFQLAHGTVQEVKELGQILHVLKNSFLETEPMTSGWMRNFSKIGSGMNFAMLGLDAYEFSQANDSYQSAIFGTQLGFDVATALVGFISAPLTVPLTGLAIGTQGLVENYNELRKRWEKVGDYFYQIDQAYKKGYEYDSNTQTLKFLEGGVIKNLDFTKDKDHIQFDTQYLYTTSKNSYSSMAIFDDAGNDDGRRENAIPIRDAIGGNSFLTIDKNSLSAETIILPTALQCYIAWHREMILSLRKCHGAGFEVLNRIEKYSKNHPLHENIFQNENTSFIPLLEKYVDEIFPSAESTQVDIVLDKQERIFIMSAEADTPWRKSRYASLTSEGDQKNLLHYHLAGNGGKYLIALNKQGSLHLSSKTGGTTWVLDARKMGNENVKIESGKITIGKLRINWDPNDLNNMKIQIIKTDQAIEIDLKNNISKIVKENAVLFNENHKNTIDAYLGKNSTQNPIFGQKYQIISNYDHNQDGDLEGKAYYDREKKSMLFSLNFSDAVIRYLSQLLLSGSTNPLNDYQLLHMSHGKFLKNGKLGAVIGEDVYFYYNYDSKDKNCSHKASYIWRVHVASGELKDFYTIPTGSTEDKIQMWQEGGKVFFSRKEIGKNEEAVFLIDPTQPFQLLSYQHTIDNIEKITVLKTLPSINPIQHHQVSGYACSHKEEKNIHSPFLTVYGKDQKGRTYRYWIKNKNGEQSIISPHLPEEAASKPENLVLCHNIQEGNENKYFFFDPIQNSLYLQIGAGNLNSGSSTNIKARRIHDKVSNVYSFGENLFALTKEGIIYQIGKNGQFILESISENWLNSQGKNWYPNLKNQVVISDRPLPIYGLKGLDKSRLSAWYYQGRLIFAPNLSGKNLQFIQADKNYAYLFDPEKGKLYKQAITHNFTLNTPFGDDYSLLSHPVISDAQDLFPTEKFKSVWKEEEMIRLITQEGTSKWYHFDSNRCITVPTIAGDLPQYLGVKTGNFFNETYYFNSKNRLFSFTYIFKIGPKNKMVSTLVEQKELGPLQVNRIGNTLLIKGSDEKDILKTLIVQNVKNIVLYGGNGEDTYILTKEAREKVKHFILNNFDNKEKNKDKLQVEVKDYYNTQLSRRGDHLIIADERGTVEIEKVFGKDKELYNHLEIEFRFQLKNSNSYHTKTYPVSDLVQNIQDGILANDAGISSAEDDLAFSLPFFGN